MFMPARDIYHDSVKNALIKDGWKITADPYKIEYEDAELYADLAIEKTENKERKIIIEIKSFISRLLINEFEKALGQYILYRNLIQLAQDEYQLIYLTIKDNIYETFFLRKSVEVVVKLNQINLLIVNMEGEEIIKWID